MSKERMLAYLEKLYGITKDIEDKLQNEKVGDKEVKNEGAEKNMELDCGMGSIEVDFE